ncbi:hypothetical protein D3C83_173940 [compost metagenome]
MNLRDVLIAGQRVAHHHRVGTIGVERAVGCVSDLKWRKLYAGVELERLVDAENGDQ